MMMQEMRCEIASSLSRSQYVYVQDNMFIGGTVAQCVALLPHSKKVVGSSPASCNMSGLVPRPFCVEFPCSPRVPPIEPQQ